MNHSTFFNAKGRISVGIFDFDGNILHPNSKLKFWNKQNEEYEYVGMVEYENNRQKYENTDTYDFPKYFDSHFENLRDFSVYNTNHAGPDILLNDTLHAIEKWELSPSMEYFKNEFLIPWRPAAILTARGHETGNFERVIRLINEKMLSEEEKTQQMQNIRNNFNLENKKKREVLDYYFQFVLSYILVSNRHDMKMQNVNNNEKIETKKAIMLEKYIKKSSLSSFRITQIGPKNEQKSCRTLSVLVMMMLKILLKWSTFWLKNLKKEKSLQTIKYDSTIPEKKSLWKISTEP